MNSVLYGVDEVAAMIAQGRRLVLAGDEALLARLPGGHWIAGTIPYFMTKEGGLFAKDRIFVTEIPSYATGTRIKAYDRETIKTVYKDAPENGFSIVIIPASSRTHLSFALEAPNCEDFATRPLIGWIAGVDLKDLGTVKPKVFFGGKPAVLEDAAVVMHVSIPETKYAEINIINIFEPGPGDTIAFDADGFSVMDAVVNGTRRNFAEYLVDNEVDTRFPLVADYCGATINISFQAIDSERRSVALYAPVFKGVEYKLAAPVEDYVARFQANMPADSVERMLFSCNCVLNYLYSGLEGKRTGGISGPITFGEIAYQLLNQTLVYLSIGDV